MALKLTNEGAAAPSHFCLALLSRVLRSSRSWADPQTVTQPLSDGLVIESRTGHLILPIAA